MRIAISGERGSFSHEAAARMLPGCSVVPCAVAAEVFQRLAQGSVAAAVIPVENSLAGSVAEHLDLLLENRAFIQREMLLRIRHNLIAAPGVRLRDLRQVWSHPVALEQCRRFFRAHPNVRPMPFYDTAGAVGMVVKQRLPDAAAIAGSHAAREYGGRVLQRDLQDEQQNYTRFVLLRRTPAILPGADKTSIAFALRNLPGALYRALSVFALRDISLARIESRPVPGKPWEYVFFVDFLRGRDAAAQNALRHLGEVAEFVKVLGVYPAARHRAPRARRRRA